MYKCDICGGMFFYPDYITEETGIGAPGGFRETWDVHVCPHCHNQEIREIDVCELCGEEEAEKGSDFCHECKKEFRAQWLQLISKFAYQNNTKISTALEMAFEVAEEEEWR